MERRWRKEEGEWRREKEGEEGGDEAIYDYPISYRYPIYFNDLCRDSL